MTQDRIRVSVVIPAYNEERHLETCLNAVLGSQFHDGAFEVLVVDNGSVDRTVAIARAHPVTLLRKEKVKVGAVRNYGAKHAKGEILVFLDADCVVDEEWLAMGVSKLGNNTRLVLGGQYLMRENPSWLEKYWVLSNSQTPRPSTALVGGCIFMYKEAFLMEAGFAEHLNSGEDSELTERLRGEGYEVVIDSRLDVVHLGYPSEIRAFIRRQMWHSSDYITNLRSSIHDKVFLLTLVFMASTLTFFASLIVVGRFYPLLLVPTVTAPLLLSYKRTARSSTSLKSPYDLVSIYCVDVLYLIGRSWGVTVSLRNALLSPSSKVKKA